MFFKDKFHFKHDIHSDIVRLSVRSSEERIDEYFLKKNDIKKFCFDFNSNNVWFGNRPLQGKIINKDAYLRINLHQNARYTYKMKIGELRLLHAEFNTIFSNMIETDYENNENIEEENTSDNPVLKRNSSNDEILNNILNELNYLRSKINEIEKRKPIEKITETIIEKQVVSEQPVIDNDFDDDEIPIFIPSKIKRSNLKGNINTEENDNDFNIQTSLEKLNKGEK